MDASSREKLLEALKHSIPKKQIFENAPMSRYTTLRLGGPADVLVQIASVEQLSSAYAAARDAGTEVRVLGNGSNLLIRDGGVRGLVLQLGELFSEVSDPVPLPDGRVALTAQGGATLQKLCNAAADYALSGLEFASGIPGTLGGTVSMNAGAYEKEMKDIVNSVRILTQEGEITEISNAEMAFGYRTSAVLKNNWIVLGATLQLQQDDPVEIQARIDDFTHRRRTRQPLEYASAGSTFKRPEGFFAAKLIDDAGMKGYSVGDAQVSEKHAGFVVNKGKASAEDVLVLMSRIQAAVKEKFGVDLKPEVRIIGE